MRVFISATKRDLDPDCRPEVRDAIALTDAHAKTMEEWNAEYGTNPVDLCREQLEANSTHFIGIFAYRLGWVPDAYDISITEAEYQWARLAKPPKQMAIYMPEPGSDAEKLLESRAADQSAQERDLQNAFRARVMQEGGYVSLFKSVPNLVSRVTARVMSWKEGGSREVGRRFGATALRPPLPMHLLGRRKHKQAFDDAWELVEERGLASIAAFLLPGPELFGRNELIKRLLSDGSVDLWTIPLCIALTWSRKDLATLFAKLGHELQPNWTPKNFAELAGKLQDNLANREIVILLSGVERFPGGLAAVIQEFWRPLRAEFTAAPARRLSVILLADAAPDAAVAALLYQPGAAAPFDPGQVFALPMLENFTRVELKTWLQSLPAITDPDAVATQFFQETNGEPWRLLPKLESEL